MKKIALLSLLLLSCASQPNANPPPSPATSAAKDSYCTFNFPEMQSGLDQNAKKFASLGPVEKNENEKVLRQTALLKSGETVEFAGGGCVHMFYAFTYSGMRRGPDSLKIALGLIKKTPLNGDNKAYGKILKEALLQGRKKAKKSGTGWILPCGDAVCALEILDHGRLRIGYDFAL